MFEKMLSDKGLLRRGYMYWRVVYWARSSSRSDVVKDYSVMHPLMMVGTLCRGFLVLGRSAISLCGHP